MTGLGCWNIANNTGLCGTTPVGATCTDLTGTGLGNNCTSGAALGSTYTCNAQMAGCPVNPMGTAQQPSQADVAPLLALMNATVVQNCTLSPSYCRWESGAADTAGEKGCRRLCIVHMQGCWILGTGYLSEAQSEAVLLASVLPQL